MNIELKRLSHRPDTIDGQIWIDGQKVCDCAENAHHCLSPGTYAIQLIKCKQHGRKMPVVLPRSTIPACNTCKKVSCASNIAMPCYCPMLTLGNGVYNRDDGSIIVGKHLARGCLINSRQAFGALYDRIRKNAERGNELRLIITCP